MSETSLNIGSAKPPEPVDIDRQKLDDAMALIRPAIQADGGDIEVVGIGDDGVITVSMSGACGTCPISTTTLKAGVERILKDRVPGVREVVDANAGSSILG